MQNSGCPRVGYRGVYAEIGCQKVKVNLTVNFITQNGKSLTEKNTEPESLNLGLDNENKPEKCGGR
jgi:hypothetical protein